MKFLQNFCFNFNISHIEKKLKISSDEFPKSFVKIMMSGFFLRRKYFIVFCDKDDKLQIREIQSIEDKLKNLEKLKKLGLINKIQFKKLSNDYLGLK